MGPGSFLVPGGSFGFEKESRYITRTATAARPSTKGLNRKAILFLKTFVHFQDPRAGNKRGIE